MVSRDLQKPPSCSSLSFLRLMTQTCTVHSETFLCAVSLPYETFSALSRIHFSYGMHTNFQSVAAGCLPLLFDQNNGIMCLQHEESRHTRKHPRSNGHHCRCDLQHPPSSQSHGRPLRGFPSGLLYLPPRISGRLNAEPIWRLPSRYAHALAQPHHNHHGRRTSEW